MSSHLLAHLPNGKIAETVPSQGGSLVLHTGARELIS